MGCLAITAYAKKGRLREFSDDALRGAFAQMSNVDGMRVAREFAALGKALQQVPGTIKIERDLQWLGVAAGEYGVQAAGVRWYCQMLVQFEFGDDLSVSSISIGIIQPSPIVTLVSIYAIGS